MKLLLSFSVLGLGSAATASAGIYSHNNGSGNGTGAGISKQTTITSTVQTADNVSGTQNQTSVVTEGQSTAQNTQQTPPPEQQASETSDSDPSQKADGEQNRAGSTEEQEDNASGTKQTKEQLDGTSHTPSVEGKGDQQKTSSAEFSEEKSDEGEHSSRTINLPVKSGTGAKNVTDTPPNSGGESGRDPKGASGSNASDGAPHNAHQESK